VGLDRGAFHPSIQPALLWVRSSKGGRSLRSWSMRHNFLSVVPDVEGFRVYKSFPRLLTSYFLCVVLGKVVVLHHQHRSDDTTIEDSSISC
jgi:hypothetical protein